MFRNVRFRAEALCSIIKADLALESISTLCAKDARAFVKELQKALPLPLPMALPLSLMLKHLSCHQRMFTCAESDDRRG